MDKGRSRKPRHGPQPHTPGIRSGQSSRIHEIEAQRDAAFEASYGAYLRAEGLLKKGEKVPMPEIFP